MMALLLGLGLAGVAVAAEAARIELGFVALLLLLYAFGLGDTLRSFQAAHANGPVRRTKPTRSWNGIIVLLGIAAVALALLVFVPWMLTNSVGQILVIILVILGTGLAIMLPVFLFLKHLYDIVRKR